MTNVAAERSRSIWMELGPLPVIGAAALDRDESCDVVVVGAGITGLSCAYELTRMGRSVVVIDRGQIGSGMTARTTAHLASSLDDYYSELERVHGEDGARPYHDSQVAAINRIEAICRDEAIDADFARVDGFLFPAEPDHLSDLQAEYETCRRIGVEVEWAERAPIPGRDSGRCLRFPRQARVHPLKYLAGLADRAAGRGARFYAETAYVGHSEEGDGVVLETAAGHRIRASAAIFATNAPVNDRVVIHTKMAPYRTYAIAGPVPKGSVPDALAWDTLEAYHYVRLQPLDETTDLLIVGGEDHRSGEADDMNDRLRALEAWTRERYPSLGALRARWSGQVMEPIDFMPFTGRNPGNRHVYVHTGDSGQGITNGVAGSLTIVPLILGEDARFADLLDPSRKPMRGPALSEFVSGQAGAAKNFAEHLGPSEVASVDEIAPGEGAVLRDGTLGKLAVYRADDGTLVRRSALCTHVGCVVHWNPFEKCWDCPCHGSQFAPHGAVLEGPATAPLRNPDAG
jgi:glycine/D-amino acid oxidase-like deaminating enzyme/nitrite reductase/ring-hydroxylating ferredoxin subunit